jgi:hypothetical protein
MSRHLGTDVVAAAGSVLDEERLAEFLGEILRNQPPDNVVDPPADVATRTRTGRDG